MPRCCAATILFSMFLPSQWAYVCVTSRLPVTQGTIRQALACVLTHLQIPIHFYSFHSFRRSGATAAFSSNVQLQNIQVHGGWRSSAIWSCLKNTRTASSIVAKTFQSIINSIYILICLGPLLMYILYI